MEIADIIPDYLLRDARLLAVYLYLLRRVKPMATKVMIHDNVAPLQSYELREELEEIERHTGQPPDVILGSLMRLAELDLIDHTIQDRLHRVRFKKLVLPRPESLRGAFDTVEYEDCLFEDFVPLYHEYVETNLAKKTLQNAARVMKLFGLYIGRKKLSQLSPNDLEEYKRSRKGKVMDSTINIDIRTLKAALEIAVAWGRIKANPFRSVKLIRLTKKPIRPLTKDEFIRLCDRIEEPWLVDIVRFAVLTGLRRGEIMNLRWENVDLTEEQISIQSSEEYRVKHGKTRNLPLNPETVAILRQQEGRGEWVFVDDGGSRLRDEYVSKKVKAYMRAAGLPEELRFHSLRGTFASWSARAGVHTYALMNLMGHASVKTTERYVTYDRDSLSEEVQKISLPGSLRGELRSNAASSASNN